MNFTAQLAVEHSRANTDFITKAIGSSTKKFKEIVDIIYNGHAPLPQRASWLLAAVNEKHPELLLPYIPLFITTVHKFKIDGIKRNMLSALSQHTIPEELQGQIVNTCFEFLLSPDETVAVKVFAMQIIANIAKQHPELQDELKAVIEDQLPKSSAAFHARAKRILKGFRHNLKKV
ncbi:MAG: hypothetical protein WAQ28_00170 [Bacteroidia bacterium]